jgi:HK97 family phage portal protein
MLVAAWRKAIGVVARSTARVSAGLRQITRVSSRSWLSWLVEEPETGAWQRNEEIGATVEAVLANPTLYACVTLIAGDISKVRPKLVELDDHGIWNEIESPAFSPFLRKPNHYQNRIAFYEWWMLSKLTEGNTYALKARDARNVVVAAHILDPTRVTPLVGPDGSIYYELQPDELAGLPAEPVLVPAREMMHDTCCPLWHPLCGVSPIYAAGAPAIHGLTMRTGSRRFFANGQRPGGVLMVPGDVSKETIERMKDKWMEQFSGDNVGAVAMLANGLTYQPIAATAEQSDLVHQVNYSDDDICRCYGVPRYKIGIGPEPPTNNVEALNLQYHAHTLQKYFEKMELILEDGLEMTKLVGRTIGVEFDRDDLIQMDTATQVKTAREAIQAGASPNEVRRRWLYEGPVEGGDVPFLQEQMWPINILSAREIPTRPPTPPAPVEVADEEVVEAEPEPEPEQKALGPGALGAYTRARAVKRLTEAA